MYLQYCKSLTIRCCPDPGLMFHPEHEAGLRPVRRSDSSLVERQEGRPGSDSLIDKFKRMLRVDSDEDTDNLHTKYKVLTIRVRCILYSLGKVEQ